MRKKNKKTKNISVKKKKKKKKEVATFDNVQKLFSILILV